jgi:hypothetical protein
VLNLIIILPTVNIEAFIEGDNKLEYILIPGDM